MIAGPARAQPVIARGAAMRSAHITVVADGRAKGSLRADQRDEFGRMFRFPRDDLIAVAVKRFS